jgi:Tfp pilus assembly protein PilO
MIREAVWQAVWRVNRIIPIGLVCLLILNLSVFLFLTYSMEKQAAQIQAEVLRLQADERRTQNERSQSESPVILYTQGVGDLQKFRQSIPDKSKLSGLVAELFSLAERAGLSIDSVQYQSKKEPEQQLLRYEINYQVTGSYEQIKKLIHLIEQSDRILFINELSLGSAREGTDVSLPLSLTTFFTTGQI